MLLPETSRCSVSEAHRAQCTAVLAGGAIRLCNRSSSYSHRTFLCAAAAGPLHTGRGDKELQLVFFLMQVRGEAPPVHLQRREAGWHASIDADVSAMLAGGACHLIDKTRTEACDITDCSASGSVLSQAVQSMKSVFQGKLRGPIFSILLEAHTKWSHVSSADVPDAEHLESILEASANAAFRRLLCPLQARR